MICVITHTDLGRNIQYLRRKKGLSREIFAEKIGISTEVLITIETADEVEIDGDLLTHISRFFHTDVETIVETAMFKKPEEVHTGSKNRCPIS